MDPNQIWQRSDAANARSEQTIANLIAQQNAQSLEDRRRREDHQFQTTEADTASGRRIKEYEADELLRAKKEFAVQGIPFKPDATMDDLASARQAFLTRNATTGLDVIRMQMDSAHARQQQAFDNLHRIASTPTLGTKAQRLAALGIALNSPSVQLLPDDLRADLHAVLARGDDPAKAMDQAIQRMQEFWGSKGVFKSTRFNNAAQFLQAYTDPLQSSASETQKVDLMGAMKALDDSNKQAESLNQQAWSHIGANAGFLPKDAISAMTSKMGPTQNPNDVMATVLGKTPAPAQPPPPPPPPPAQASPPAPSGSIQRMANDWSKSGGFVGRSNIAVPSGIETLSNPFANFVPDEPSPEQAEQASAAAQPVTPGQVQAFRAATIAQSPKSGLGGAILVPPSPMEKTKIESVVRAGLQAKGMAPPDIDKFISDANQKIQSGDPAAISSANALLKMVRAAGQSPLATPGYQPDPAAPVTNFLSPSQ